MAWMQWAPYVSVAQRRANALLEMNRLRKKGKNIQPVQIEGRKIAQSFWGKGWCDHLESFSDFDNRLPRGRTYVRNGSVCHLDVRPGHIEAIVSGSKLYNTRIDIKKLKPAAWKSVKKNCSGRIGSMLELLQGRLSDQVMTVVTDRKQGLFPQPREIKLSCDCPDWAVMCKHVAAALYGIGSRLDSRPDLLFILRGVDAQELISTEMAVPAGVAGRDALANDQLGEIFGIDLDVTGDGQSVPKAKSTKRHRAKGRVTPAKTNKKHRGVARHRSAPPVVLSAISKNAKRKHVARGKGARIASNNRKQARSSNEAAPRIRPTGKSVARLRRRLGITAAEFARRLGVSATSVYRWEAMTGRLKLQARPLAAMAKLQQQAR